MSARMERREFITLLGGAAELIADICSIGDQAAVGCPKPGAVGRG